MILAGEWLSGDPATAQHLRDKDRIIAGSPLLISDPKQAGQLRKQLKNQLLRSGKNISEGHYAPQIIKEENDTVNQLVQGFQKSPHPPLSKGEKGGFEPFSTDGSSHIDFVLIPETVTPADASQIKDIEYKIRSFFLGEKMAQILRSKCIETNYYAPLNPDDYIGNWKKPAYFDMYLDIRISTRKLND